MGGPSVVKAIGPPGLSVPTHGGSQSDCRLAVDLDRVASALAGSAPLPTLMFQSLLSAKLRELDDHVSWQKGLGIEKRVLCIILGGAFTRLVGPIVPP